MSEEKTRVLRETVAPAAAEPGKIVFHCPNGHRIVVDAKYAGKKGGKCNKCGVPVVIPRSSSGPPAPKVAIEPVLAIEPAAPTIDQIGVGELPVVTPPGPEAALSDIGEPPAVGPVATEPPLEVPQVAAPADEPDMGVGWNFVGDSSSPPAVDAGGWSDDVAALPPAAEPGDHPTARLVARLWAELEHGGVVEVHLAGGSVLVPRWFDASWSRGTHALFGSQAADQSVTLTAVAWETVQKVVVRQLTELPDDMFT